MKITITNGKGGTGKTTLTTYLSEFLFRHGKKVLIIDLDPNCCISEVYDKVLLEQTSRLLLTGQEVKPYEVKRNAEGGLISIIPSELNLSMISNIIDTQLKYQIKKQGFENQFDFILIDPPGTWSAHNRNAVFAADTVVVCGKCSKLDRAATMNYMQQLQECCLDSEIIVVCNAYNPRRDPDNNLQGFKDDFGPFLLQEPIPLLNSFQKIVGNSEYKIQKNIENRLDHFVSAVTQFTLRRWGE